MASTTAWDGVKVTRVGQRTCRGVHAGDYVSVYGHTGAPFVLRVADVEGRRSPFVAGLGIVAYLAEPVPYWAGPVYLYPGDRVEVWRDRRPVHGLDAADGLPLCATGAPSPRTTTDARAITCSVCRGAL